MLLKYSHKCILNDAVAMIYLLFLQVQLRYKRSWSSQNKLEVVMNSHTPKKVSVSCSLIKKKKGFNRQFWLCLWRSSWGKAVFKKNNISVPLGFQRNRPDRVPWSSISESGNEQIQNYFQFLWPELEFVQRHQLSSISRRLQRRLTPPEIPARNSAQGNSSIPLDTKIEFWTKNAKSN